MTSRKPGPVMESPNAKQSHRQQVKSMLCDAIKVLCGNTISYSSCLSIEALIGVTVDDSEVILINVNEFLERQPNSVSQELNDCDLDANLEPVSCFMMTSNDRCIKADPSTEQEMFDILSDEVIQIEDEEKKELDDLQATICIKEEDQLNCLIGDGNYGNDVYESSSQLQADSSFLMDGQFYSGSSVALAEEYSRLPDSRSFSSSAKWQTYPTETARGGTSFPPRPSRNGAFNCRLCKKTFGTQAVYLRHKRKYHQPAAKTVSESSTFNSANFSVNNSSATDENWTMGASSLGRKNSVLSEEVTNMTVYTCSICGKTIRHQSSFLRHKRQHEGIVYKCDLCGAVISRRDALQVHKRKCAMRVQQMSNC